MKQVSIIVVEKLLGFGEMKFGSLQLFTWVQLNGHPMHCPPPPANSASSTNMECQLSPSHGPHARGF